MNRWVLFWVLILCISADAAAQMGEITGRVVAKEDGSLLSGANIEVLGQSSKRLGATADANGVFRIVNVPTGVYVLKVTFVGYLTLRIEKVTVNDGRATDVKVVLVPSAFAGQEMVVSASRRPERMIEAPTEVSIIESDVIQARPVVSPADHLKGVQSVDVVTTGLSSSRVVVRGFNGAFSGRLLALTDNRIANAPGLQVTALQWVPATDDDIDRMEVIEGPASAIYGPNAAGGVLHIITKSPFESKGTKVSVGMGERSFRTASFRYAGTLNDQVGYKISMKYHEGKDWAFKDPAEPDSIVRGHRTGLVRVPSGGLVSNERDLSIDGVSVDARVDFRPNEELKAVVAGGFARNSDLSITGIGTVQIKDWIGAYTQARLSYKDLFVQAFYNQNAAGKNLTYNRSNGNYVIDDSYVFVTQAQHGVSFLDDRQSFMYGVDVLITRPKSEGTSYGRFEDNDDYNQYGYYLQSNTRLSDRLRFIAAGRIDHQNTLDGVVFSPRTALVFTPQDKNHSFRVTFNRAFQMPTPLQNFNDVNVLPSLGPLPFGIQLMGNPPLTGWTFQRDANGGVGGLYMQSPFTPASAGGSSAVIPAEATQMWPVIVAIMNGQGVDLSGLPAPTPDQVGSELKTLSFVTSTFVLTPPENIVDWEPLKPRETTTYELGYKGVLNDQLYLTANVYYEQNKNFIIFPLSSNVFYKKSDLAAYFSEHMSSDDANALAEGISGIPVGTITPNEIDQSDLMLTFVSRNQRTSHYGIEAGIRFYPDEYWTLSANHSYRSKNLFKSNQVNLADVPFNAPKNRFGASIKYDHAKWGIDATLRMRVTGKMFASAGSQGAGDIEGYTVFDLSGGYKLPFDRRLKVSFSIQNVLNNKHVEFIAVPEVGRFGMVRLQYSM